MIARKLHTGPCSKLVRSSHLALNFEGISSQLAPGVVMSDKGLTMTLSALVPLAVALNCVAGHGVCELRPSAPPLLSTCTDVHWGFFNFSPFVSFPLVLPCFHMTSLSFLCLFSS